MNFSTEPAPPRDVALDVRPGIRRVVANNPGPMTYHGTNTYLLDWEGGAAVVDPGPDDAGHVAAIMQAAGAPIAAILLTHGHRDHVGALPALRAATGAPVHGFDPALAPDRVLADGDTAGAWTAVHTPGHAADHLCFARGDGVVLSGDHVMGWSTTVVGDMAAYFRSLERVIGLEAQVLLPGHGPAVDEPGRYARALLGHRRMREASVLAALNAEPVTLPTLVARLYPDLAPDLLAAAERSVAAHLAKLEQERRAARQTQGWVQA